MKKIYINQDFIILEEEKKKLFGGVNITKRKISLNEIISVGKIMEEGEFIALDIILKNNDEINLSTNDEGVDLMAILNQLQNVSNNWEKFKLDVVEI